MYYIERSMNQDILNLDGFIALLKLLAESPGWTASVENQCIHLRRTGSDNLYSPLTSAFFLLTGEELHRGSFWHPEITERFGLPWWEIREISYACIALGFHNLREKMLVALDPIIKKPAID